MGGTVHMDPSIWSKTPEDIIFLIIEASDRATQISWSPTRRVFYKYQCPRVWSHLDISPFDIDGYAGNPELSWWPGLTEHDGQFHFMAKHAARENKLERMASYIEFLLVDVRGDLTKDVLTLTSLAAGFGVVGLTWPWISKSWRSSKASRASKQDAYNTTKREVWWRESSDYDQINLEIPSRPWVNDEDPRHYLAGGETYDSPLMSSFYPLNRRHGPSRLRRGLPSTFETLILRDRFHLFGKPTKQIHLRAACRNCRSLRRTELTHPTHEQACEFFLTFEQQPGEERFGKTKLASLKVPDQSLGKICDGITDFRHMPSPGIWKFAFVRDPEDVLESAKGYERRRSENSAQFRATVSDGNGKLNQEFRTIKSEKLT